MHSKSTSKRTKFMALLIVILLSLYSFPTVVIAQTNWSLYGWDQKQGKWDSGNVQGYKEGDNVPFMLTSTEFDMSESNWTVVLDYKDGNITGYDDAGGWFIGPIANDNNPISSIAKTYTQGASTFDVVRTGPVNESSVTVLKYKIIPTADFLKTLETEGNWALYWTCHLSKTGINDRITGETIDQGSGFWTGSSLHVKFLPNSGHMDVPINVDYIPGTPKIEVTKTASTSTVESTGEDVTFTVSVKNTGDVNVMLNSLTDDIYGDISDAENSEIKGTNIILPEKIVPGSTYSSSFVATVGGDPGSTHTNIVTASALYNKTTITASDSESISIQEDPIDILPDISVTKTASVASVPETGGTVQFTVVIQNNASEIAFIDSVMDKINEGDYAYISWDNTPGDPPDSLAGNSSWTGTFTRSIAGTYPGSDTDTVKVVAYDPQQNEDTATDDATVIFTEVNQEEPAPTVTLVKTVDVTEQNAPGGTFNYTLTITNTSEFPVTISALTDTYQNLSDYVDDTIQPVSQLIINYPVQHTGVGTFSNTASVTVSANDKTATANDTQTVTVVDNSEPSVTLVKTVDDTSKVAPGTFTYTVTITNTSNSPVVITSLTDTYNPAIFSGLTESEKSLDPAEVLIIAYDVTHDDVNSYVNTASVTVTARNGKTASATDSITVIVYEEDQEEPIPPTVTLVKTVDDTSKVAPGGTFNYTITITNTSDFPVTIIELEDSVIDLGQYLNEGDEDLDAGESLVIEYSVTYTGVGSYTNTASVEVTAENELTDTADDSVTVTVTPADDDDDDDGDDDDDTPPTLLVESAVIPTLEVHAGEIPQTGDTSNAPFAAGSLLFLLFSGLGLYGWFRKEQKESES